MSPEREELHRELANLKRGKVLDDADYFQTLVHVVFFSGFKAEIVEGKLPIIDRHFPDYQTVANYEESDLETIAQDPQMIRHKAKIRACYNNAKEFREIVRASKSFGAYVESFDPKASHGNLMRLRDDLVKRFRYLGGVTSLHFLMTIGTSAVKPDLSVMRIFSRLGIIDGAETEENFQKVLRTAEQIAQGFEGECPVTRYCNYYAERSQ